MAVTFNFENRTSRPVSLDCYYIFMNEEIGKSILTILPAAKFELLFPPQETREFFIRLVLTETGVKFNQGTRTPNTVIMGLVRERDQAGEYAIVKSNE